MENVTKLCKSGVYAVFIYLGVDTGKAEVLFWLMALDTILGILKSLRLEKKISLRVLGWGVVTKLAFLVIPMVVALIAKGLNMDFSAFVIACVNVLIVNEGISSITNIMTIKTGVLVENTDYITRLLNAIRNVLEALIKKALILIEGTNKK